MKTESRKGKTKTAFKKKQKNRSANQVLTLLIAVRQPSGAVERGNGQSECAGATGGRSGVSAECRKLCREFKWQLDAKVIKVDAANDLALLKAVGKFTPLPVVARRGVKLGGTVATVGFPNIGMQGFSPKLAP